MVESNFTILEDRGILAVSGPDRRLFLQGLVSNDVEKLAENRAIYAALLTAQGKYLHDFIMVEVGEAIWLDAVAVAAVFGEGALAALGLSGEPGETRSLDGGVALVDPRLARLGARAILDRSHLAGLGSELAQVDFAAYDRHRLALGIPDGSRDMVPDKSILLEAGFDELNGVDWQKGCYVGQELTARTKYRGTMVTAEGRDAGEIRSSRDGQGLALLRLDAVVSGRALLADGAPLAPLKPDWMRIDPGGGQ
jgi:folate-binding protein YgfZ